MFLCSTINSPLTTSITGQLKGILQTIFGLFAFNGVDLTPALNVGLITSTVGGVWYGALKYNEQVSKGTKDHGRAESESESEDNAKS